jgi:hypothetical protein
MRHHAAEARVRAEECARRTALRPLLALRLVFQYKPHAPSAARRGRRAQVMHQFYMRYTGLERERVEEECDRDNFMSPQRAAELGVIDGLISAPPSATMDNRQFRAVMA